MSFHPEFAELLQQHLRTADRSGAWLAQRIDVSASTVTRWCSGETRPGSPEVVIQVADVLGIHDRQTRTALLQAAGYAYVAGDDASDDASRSDESPERDATPVDHPISMDEGGTSLEIPLVEQEPPATLPAEVTETPVLRPLVWPTLNKLIIGGLLIAILGIASFGALTNRWNRQPSLTEFVVHTPRMADEQTPHPAQELTRQTQRFLYTKLGTIEGLRGIRWDTPLVNPAEVAPTILIQLETQIVDSRVRLIADVDGQDGVVLGSTSVEGLIEPGAREADICLLDLQNQLALKILDLLEAKVALHIGAMARTTMQHIPTQSCQALRLNNQAVELATLGRLENAQLRLQSALDIDPNYADARNNLGWILRQKGDVEGARAAYQEAVDRQPTNPIYHYNLGVTDTMLRNYPQAIQHFTRSVIYDPEYVEAFNNLGYTYLEQGQLDEAEEALTRALALSALPASPVLYKNLGRLYLDRSEFDRAIQQLTQAVDLRPDEPYAEAFYYLARAYAESAQQQQACTALHRYQQVASQDEITRVERAKTLSHQLHC